MSRFPRGHFQEFTSLDQIKNYFKIVLDAGNDKVMKRFKSFDASTGLTYILKRCSKTRIKYVSVIAKAVEYGKSHGTTLSEQVQAAFDMICVLFGKQVLKFFDGQVSTELDAKYSFDKEGIIFRSRKIVALYETLHIDREKILIKFPATWEGIQAAH